MKRALLVAIVVAVGWPGAALADTSPVAEIVGTNGETIARANVGPWSSPDYGYSLQISSSVRTPAGVELQDVSILGGRLHVDRMFVPASGAGGAQIEGLTVDGVAVSSAPNTLVELGSGNYAMVLQQAVLPGRLRKDIGVVGLRVVLGSRQLLVGLERPAVSVKTARRRGRSSGSRRLQGSAVRHARSRSRSSPLAARSESARSRLRCNFSVSRTSGPARARSAGSTAPG